MELACVGILCRYRAMYLGVGVEEMVRGCVLWLCVGYHFSADHSLGAVIVGPQRILFLCTLPAYTTTFVESLPKTSTKIPLTKSRPATKIPVAKCSATAAVKGLTFVRKLKKSILSQSRLLWNRRESDARKKQCGRRIQNITFL